ncbi:hypothetical protein BT93_I1617 [Corymbia citriodora subsp. variegata]|nr:hypothetical protein BT93_I1617 [Corymbia citriodora subsp. variegata]
MASLLSLIVCTFGHEGFCLRSLGLSFDFLFGFLVEREIGVQFAKYGPNAERIDKGRIAEPVSKIRRWLRSRSPHPRFHPGLINANCKLCE